MVMFHSYFFKKRFAVSMFYHQELERSVAAFDFSRHGDHRRFCRRLGCQQKTEPCWKTLSSHYTRIRMISIVFNCSILFNVVQYYSMLFKIIQYYRGFGYQNTRQIIASGMFPFSKYSSYFQLSPVRTLSVLAIFFRCRYVDSFWRHCDTVATPLEWIF